MSVKQILKDGGVWLGPDGQVISSEEANKKSMSQNASHSFTEGADVPEEFFVEGADLHLPTKPISNHLNTACKAIEKQIAKYHLAIDKLQKKKNEIDVSIDLLKESISGLQEQIKKLRS